MSAAPRSCPSCGTRDVRVFHRVRGVPVNSVLRLTTREEALALPRRDIELAFCRGCAFIYNAAFDPATVEYSGRYEETQGFSKTFRDWEAGLARRLVERHGLRDKRILEIGCGKGDFLVELCRLGWNRGVGFDPAYDASRRSDLTDGRVRFVPDFYDERHSDAAADFVVCKMTLEHLPETGSFAGMVRRCLGPRLDTVLFIQVPDVIRILTERAFWDVYYEHCNYFSAGSLARLFRRNDFDVLSVHREYEGQYLTLEARAADAAPHRRSPGEEEVAVVAGLVAAFERDVEEVRKAWRARLDQWRSQARRVVVWGSGSKGVAFLTTLGAAEHVERVVDVNPHRQGCFMAGTAHPIVAPQALKEAPPDVVVVMNAIYREEIAQDLASMGLSPKLVTL